MKKDNSKAKGKQAAKDANDVISILDSISKEREKKPTVANSSASVKQQDSETVKKKVSKTKKAVKEQSEVKVKKIKPQLVDKSKSYGLIEAIELLKKISKTKFKASLDLHINTLEKGIKVNVALPFGTGKQIKVAVVSDELLEKIGKGEIDFDVLIAHPSFMPKLAKLAKILGPKGLMPNPKNGTVTPNVEKAVETFAKGQVQIKTESDFPLIHQLVGKIDMKTEEIEANVRAIVEGVKKNRIKNVFLAATMSPSVRLDVEKI